MDEIEQLKRAIHALESQRTTLGNAVVDAALLPMRDKLAMLQSQTAAEQRKLVTVLFADLAGFTAMSEKMDPEDVREVVNAYFRRWTASIDAFNGEIEKFIGDAVMAVFGLSTAREDDPERAIRSALSMQNALSQLNDELEAEWGLRLKMRVGIHTGPVVVSLLDERRATDFVVVGDSVNLASRLQSSAPLDGILISHDTYRHVRGIFDLQALPPVQVKGKSEPIPVYLVLQAKPRAFRLTTRGVEGIETPMVGRDTELKRLQDAFYDALEYAERHFITIIGEAGIGKSRLLYEFDQWLDLLPEKVRYFKGRADPTMEYIAFSLLRNLLAFRYEIHDSDPALVVQQKLETGMSDDLSGAPLDGLLAEEDGLRRAAHFVGHLAGFSFSDTPYLSEIGQGLHQFQNRAYQYLESFLRALLASHPVVILLEDLHWADDSSLDAFNRVAEQLAEQPLLIVATARHAFLQRRPHWGEGYRFHSHMPLEILSRRDGLRLVDEILDETHRVPDTLREMVVRQAEGNPFFVEELIKMLIEDHVLFRADDCWQVDLQRLDSARVPPTLVGVLQARLDSLHVEERSDLQRGAVIGRIFWDRAVSFLAAEREREQEASHALERLRGREMIFRREYSSFSATNEYIFKHSLLRDVAYESLLKRQRQFYHQRTALWLEQMAEQYRRSGEYAALIAEHFELALQSERAAHWYLRAGRDASARYAHAAALHAFGRALALAPAADDTLRFEILLAREKLYELHGAQEERLRDLQALETLVEEQAGPEKRATIALRQATFAFATADFTAASVAAQKASELAEAANAMELAADAFLLLAQIAIRHGELERAQTFAVQALDLARDNNWQTLQANSLRHLGLISYYAGRAQDARDYFEQALNLFIDLGDRFGEAQLLNNLGGATFNLGDYAAAGTYYELSLRLARKIGDRTGEGKALNNLGIAAVAQGNYDRAEDCYLQALAITREVGHRSYETSNLDNLGNLALYRYQYVRSQKYHRESLHAAREIGDRVAEGFALINLGRGCLSLGLYDDAYTFSSEALALNQEVGDTPGKSHALTNLSRYYLEMGEVERAYDLAQQVVALSPVDEMPSERAAGLHARSEALAALGNFDDAAESFHATLHLRRELNESREAVESQAGLASTLLHGGNLQEAHIHATEVLSAMQALDFLGFDQPVRILLRCHDVLNASQDPRAPEALQKGYQLLQECAVNIEDAALKHTFLNEIADHRRLLEMWQRQQ